MTVLSLAALLTGAIVATSQATGNQPSQLRIKPAPRSLPPVTRDSAVRQASAEMPRRGDEQIQNDFDDYIANLPPEPELDGAALELGAQRSNHNRPPMADPAVLQVDATESPSEGPSNRTHRAVHLEQPPRSPVPIPPAVVPRSLVTESARKKTNESYAVTADKAVEKTSEAAASEVDGQPIYTKSCGSCYKNCKRFWLQADYLQWWTKGSQLPPLVTTSPQGTPRTQAGVLNQPGTTVLFGNEAVNNDERSGYRLRFGYWLDRCCRVGLEAEFLDLEETSSDFDVTSPGDPILARPFFNVVTGLQDSELVAYPGVIVGRVNVSSSSDLHSGGVRFRKNICCRNWCVSRCGGGSCCNRSGGSASYRVDWLAGYRYLRLDDDLGIRESLVSTDTGGVLAQGTMFEIFDDFQTDNEFHGGELGLVGEYRRGRWGMKALAKVALGNNHEVVRINGGTVVTVPGVASASNVGGLLAQNSNIGTFGQDEFAVLPEASLSMYYQLTCNVRATVGYNFLYLSHVLRPGDQIDFGLNPTQFPPGILAGAARPAFAFNDTDFWAQGLNFGVEVRR